MVDEAPATSPKKKPLDNKWVGRVVFVGVVVAAVYLFNNSGGRGQPATRADLIGHWVHQGDDIVVDLIFHDDGTFERHPTSVDLRSGTWGTSIPVAGAWVLQDRGVLVLVGAGSFKPFVRGDRLNLQAETDRNVGFEFRRKPLPPATRNVQ